MNVSLPTVRLSADDRPGEPITAYAINAAQRTGANRGSLGASLLLPLEQDRSLPAIPLLVWGSLCWNGESEGIPIPAQTPSRMTIPTMLSVPVTDEQIARLESKRAGGQTLLDIRLNVLADISGRVVTCSSGGYPTMVVIPRDEWHKILSMLGYGERRLIEFPPAPKTNNAVAAVQRVVTSPLR